jgi:vanillate O-demethylase monooxygenase subunit
LSQGKVIGNNIQCGYHGIVYGPDGNCVRIPSQGNLPASCRIRSYPAVEQWQWIWIWMGDPSLADPALIPDHHDMGLTDPEFVSAVVYHEEIDARYPLLHDNLLDLSHVAFLHGSTLGGGSARRHSVGDGPGRSGDRLLSSSSRLTSRSLSVGAEITSIHAHVLLSARAARRHG